MRISVVTLFPGYFGDQARVGVVSAALDSGALDLEAIDLREFGIGPYRQVDDAPYGGGPGMVLMVEPLAAALDEVPDAHKVVLTPAGNPLRQATLSRWSQTPHLALVCGRYEGIDERVAEHLADEEVSLGDFVLAGGEAAALAIVEGVARLLPGVVGNPDSLALESFGGEGLLEEAQYTRPADFRGWRVPDVLLSGDHRRIDAWRLQERLRRTRRRRPDLLGDLSVGDQDG